MREPGVRPEFWITIIAAVVVVALMVTGHWEWGVVAMVALVIFGRVPFINSSLLVNLVTAVSLVILVVTGHWDWALVGLIGVLVLRLWPRLWRR